MKVISFGILINSYKNTSIQTLKIIFYLLFHEFIQVPLNKASKSASHMGYHHHLSSFIKRRTMCIIMIFVFSPTQLLKLQQNLNYLSFLLPVIAAILCVDGQSDTLPLHGNSNTKLLFPLNNIFQQKFNMATPNNFQNRYSSFPYQVSLGSWPLTSQQQLSFAAHMRLPSLSQHFAYPYMMPPNYLSLSPLSPFASSSLAYPHPPQAFSSMAIPEQKRERVQNKNQKTQKSPPKPTVIEISDDEDPPQPEKPCEDRSASTSSKPQGIQSIINTKTLELIKKQQAPLPKKQERKPKERVEVKPPKTKEIYKPTNHKKKSKNEKKQKQIDAKKGPVFSQRINQKNETKKEPYRLTKKERELLEISFLREIANEILTGPQFQARLPHFVPHQLPSLSSSVALATWKKELKASLLERMENQEE